MAATIPSEQPSDESTRIAIGSTSTQSNVQYRPALAHERGRALAMLFDSRGPRAREPLFRWAYHVACTAPQNFAGLYVAVSEAEVRGVAWAYPLPGRQVNMWLPVLIPGEPIATGSGLLEALDRHAERSDARLTMAAWRSGNDTLHMVASQAYRYITDMGRMECHLPDELPEIDDPALQFLPYRACDGERLKAVLVRTSQDSLDCPGLRGSRHVDDILHGHLHRDQLVPSHWRIVHCHGRDVGCVLVSRHQVRQDCEVVYLGLVPEARGQGWGRLVIRQAQRLARSAGAKRLLLGCDVNNPPALRTYLRAGFREFDRWSLFAKTLR